MALLGLGETCLARCVFESATEALGKLSSQEDVDSKLELRCLNHSNLAWLHFCTKEFATVTIICVVSVTLDCAAH